jgi:hypothetical protein
MRAFAIPHVDVSDGAAHRVRAPRDCGLTFAAMIAAAILLSLASPANAQVVPTTTDVTAPPWNAQRIFDPTPLPLLTDSDSREQMAPEDMPVKDRQHPGYEQIGIRDGSWMFLPSFMAGALYDSNVFSSSIMKRSDVAAVVEPSLRAHTLWERNGVDLTFDAQQTAYKGNPGLDQTNASLKGNAWYDVSNDLAVLTNFEVAHLNVGVGTLASPLGAVQPTPYNLFSGDVSVRKEFNRLTTSVGFRTDSYDYGSTKAENGTVINQDSLDGQVYSLHGRVDYAISEMFGWFAAAEGNERNVRGQPGQPLDSQGYRALSGVTMALTHLITGEIGAGYVQQSFVDQTIGTISGPSYRAMLTWRPTPLIDVHFKAEQIVSETSQTSSQGVLGNAMQLGADYELRRNVILSVTGAYEVDRFFGTTRKDDVFTTDARIKYMLNQYGYLSVYHEYTTRSSDVPVYNFDKNLVGINVTAQF